MQENILLSVIIPCYNVEKFISKTLDSVISEKLENYEIILVNDGSADKTFEKLKEYSLKVKNIKIINQNNFGVSNARNVGIQNSKGKYLYFIDGDDYLIKGTLGKYLKKLDNKIDIFLFNNIINKNDKDYDTKNNLIANLYSSEEILKNIFLKNILKTVMGNFIVKKEIIIKNKIKFDENYKYSEDYNFLIKCLNYSDKVYYTNENIFVYRKHNLSTMAKKINFNRLDSIRAIEILSGLSKIKNNQDIRNYYNIFYNMALIGNINELIRKDSTIEEVKKYLNLLNEFKIREISKRNIKITIKLRIYFLFFKLYSINKMLLYRLLKIIISIFKL